MKRPISNPPSFDEEDMDFWEDDIMGDSLAEYTNTSSSSHKKPNKPNKQSHTSIAQASQRIQAEHHKTDSLDANQSETHPSKSYKRSSRNTSHRSSHERDSAHHSSSSNTDLDDTNYEEYLNDDFDEAFEQEAPSKSQHLSHSSHRSRRHSYRESQPLSNADDSIEDTDESTEEIDSLDTTEDVSPSPYQEYLQEETPDSSSSNQVDTPSLVSNSNDETDDSASFAAMSRKEPTRSIRKDDSTPDASNSTSQKRLTLKKGTGDISRDEMMQIRHSFEDIILRSFILVIERSQPLDGGAREPRTKAYLLTGGTLAECFQPKCFTYNNWEWYVDGTTHDFYFEGSDKKRGKLFCQYRRVNKATTIEQLKKLMDRIQNNNPYEISLSARTSDLGSTILEYFVVKE